MASAIHGDDAHIEHNPSNPKIMRLVRPGDKQLIELFKKNPKKKMFYDFVCFLDDRELGQELDMDTQFTLITEKFPDVKERLEFLNFSEWWARRWTMLKPRISKADDFLAELRGTNYADPDARAHWLWTMQMGSAPFLRLGESKHGGFFTGYGIERAPGFLAPGFYDSKTDGLRTGNSENGDRTIHGSILGIDRNTGNAAPQRATPPHHGISGPFVFAQLGNLFAYNGATSWGDLRRRSNDEILGGGTWDQTRFGVVVSLSSEGAPGSVYVIYNGWEHDPDTGEDTLIRPENMKKDFVGRVHRRCGNSQRFTVAKVADDLSDLLNPSREFDFNIISTKEPVLVEVMQGSQGSKSFLVGDFAA